MPFQSEMFACCHDVAFLSLSARLLPRPQQAKTAPAGGPNYFRAGKKKRRMLAYT